MPIHGALFRDFAEGGTQDQFSLQNDRMLKVQMGYGPVWARAGSMVAYQGDIRFENKGAGRLGRLVKSAATGEGVRLMQCSGPGELFLANNGAQVQIMYLENDMVSVNGSSILSFSSTIDWDINRISARGAVMTGGLFNVTLRGTGYVAISTRGEPVALDVASAPTFGDPQAVVLWTSGVTMDVRVDMGGAMSVVRGGTGEAFQMAFGGQGYVLIQPDEGVPNAS